MKEKKSVKLSEKKKHLLMYLSLLAAAVFFAIQNPNESWLAISIAIGLAISYAPEGIRWIKSRKTDAPVQSASEQPDETDHEEEQNR
nr:hypothetical protein [uncultured Caproiciproducens sp.]